MSQSELADAAVAVVAAKICNPSIEKKAGCGRWGFRIGCEVFSSLQDKISFPGHERTSCRSG